MHILLLELELDGRVDEVNDDGPGSPRPLQINTIINAIMHRGKFYDIMKNRGNE